MRDGFGRQDREAFDRQRALHLLIDAIHARGDRSSPAIGGESIYRIRLPHHQRLDASIAPIAHPAGQLSRPGRPHRLVTKRYTLNQTVNAQTTADHIRFAPSHIAGGMPLRERVPIALTIPSGELVIC